MVFCGRAKALAAPKPAAPSPCGAAGGADAPRPGFHHRLAAQSYRFLQQQPQVEHWAVLVITPHGRLKLGPTQALQVFLEQQVMWLNLEELSCRPQLDPLLNLLTLPVRPESELAATSQQILASRPDLDTVVLPMLVQGFPQLTMAVSSRGQKSW